MDELDLKVHNAQGWVQMANDNKMGYVELCDGVCKIRSGYIHLLPEKFIKLFEELGKDQTDYQVISFKWDFNNPLIIEVDVEYDEHFREHYYRKDKTFTFPITHQFLDSLISIIKEDFRSKAKAIALERLTNELLSEWEQEYDIKKPEDL